MTSALLSEQLLAELDSLTESEQQHLQQGQVVVSGRDGEYIARVLVDAPIPLVWEVLTDYENFPNFLPSVLAAEVTETEGNRVVVEQTNQVNVLLTDIESTIRTENTEFDQQRVAFVMTQGDLEQFEGNWQIAATADHSHLKPQTLIRQSVQVEADLGLLDSTFYSMFRGTLEESLSAIRAEIERRQDPNGSDVSKSR